MTTPKQDLKRLKTIEVCHNHVRAKGPKPRVVIMMPGTPGRQTRRRFSAKGPRGQIITLTHDQKKILVMFKADQLLTSLEVIRNGSVTG
jgi:DNA-binding NarL/FixJ family response regulator